ncbi:MAG: hypothetical protein ACLQF1_22085 [Methyloceanibacter sp.]|jgi:hypothetical protein
MDEGIVITIMLETFSPESSNGSGLAVGMTTPRPKEACWDAAGGADLSVSGTTDTLASTVAAGVISIWRMLES